MYPNYRVPGPISCPPSAKGSEASRRASSGIRFRFASIVLKMAENETPRMCNAITRNGPSSVIGYRPGEALQVSETFNWSSRSIRIIFFALVYFFYSLVAHVLFVVSRYQGRSSGRHAQFFSRNFLSGRRGEHGEMGRMSQSERIDEEYANQSTPPASDLKTGGRAPGVASPITSEMRAH